MGSVLVKTMDFGIGKKISPHLKGCAARDAYFQNFCNGFAYSCEVAVIEVAKSMGDFVGAVAHT